VGWFGRMGAYEDESVVVCRFDCDVKLLEEGELVNIDAYVLHGLRSGAAGFQDPCQGLEVPRRLFWDGDLNNLSL